MTPFTRILLVFGALSVVACSSRIEPSVPDASLPEVDASQWGEVDTECGYSFTAPDDLREIPVQGIDSCVTRFEAGDCKYFGDYGGFSNPLEPLDEPNPTTVETEIDGVRARIVTFGPLAVGTYHAGVHLPIDGDGPKLTLQATCSSQAGTQIARALFDTIRF